MADRIKTWRSRHGLKQAELAAELGVRMNTVYRWEAGVHPVPPFLPLALAELERVLDGRKAKNAKRT
jgi:transcriptional regulator with XRE-family HTH domain